MPYFYEFCYFLILGKCYFAGKPYEENEYFVFKSCDGYCRCTNTGYFNCSTVCKISTDECKADEKEITVKYLSPLATRCVCEARKCLNKPPLPTMKPGKSKFTNNVHRHYFPPVDISLVIFLEDLSLKAFQ